MTTTLSGPDAQASQIVETIHEPLLVLGPEFHVRQANPAFYEAFSLRTEDAVGKLVFEVGKGDFDAPELRGHLREVADENASFENVQLDCAAGTEERRMLRVNGRRLVGRSDEEVRILLAIQDITEQRVLEEKLRTHTRELERSNADLEEFAYAASHDLQEPLRMVSSYLQLLERRYKEELDETAQEFIEYAVDGAQRMKALINSLLQYSRVGRKEGEFGETELGPMVDNILDDLGRHIEETGAEVTRDRLPTAYGNPDQLRRLVQNLIENALTYCGDRPPRVHVSSTAEDGEIHLTVEDNGPGIPPEAQDKIFRIFGQLDPHGSGQKGTGMGLAICRKIAERHEGRIWVESEPDEGSVFHVTLSLTS